MSLIYRTSQFIHSLSAKPDDQLLASAAAHLTACLRSLFLKQARADLVHSLSVFDTLRKQGENHPVLLSAALLHDIGKSRYPLQIWERILIVLGQWFFPGLVRRWGEGHPRGVRRPFVVAAKHPAWGAEMIGEAGGTELLVDLVKRHQDLPSDLRRSEHARFLGLLQAADGRN